MSSVYIYNNYNNVHIHDADTIQYYIFEVSAIRSLLTYLLEAVLCDTAMGEWNNRMLLYYDEYGYDNLNNKMIGFC